MDDYTKKEVPPQNEGSFHEKEAFLSLMAEASPDAIVLGDQRLRILYCNAALIALFGYTREELLGANCAMLVPEDIRGGFEAFLKNPEAAYKTSGIIAETRCLLKSGAEVHIEASNFFWKKGGELFFGAIFHNISERKRIERELQNERLFLQRIFDATGDGLLVSDAQGMIVKCNQSLLEMFACREKDLIGRYLLNFYTDDSASPETPDALRMLMSQGSVKGFQTRCKTYDRRAIDVEMNMVLMRDNTDTVTGTVSAIRDISERKEQERQREELIKELQDALAKVKQLEGMLPICSWCKKVRDDKGYWQKIEAYIGLHTKAGITHGICPDCAKKVLDELKSKDPLASLQSIMSNIPANGE
jgi:PAS domain S-box-containing protein